MKKEKKSKTYFGEEYPGWFNPNVRPYRRPKPTEKLPHSQIYTKTLSGSATREELFLYDFTWLEARSNDYDESLIVLYFSRPEGELNPKYDQEMKEWREQGKRLKDWKFLKARYNKAKDLLLLKELIKKHGVPEEV